MICIYIYIDRDTWHLNFSMHITSHILEIFRHLLPSFGLSFGSMSFLNDISIDFVSKASEATRAQWLTCSAVQMVAFWWQTPRMARPLGSARSQNISHTHIQTLNQQFYIYTAQYGWGNILVTTSRYSPRVPDFTIVFWQIRFTDLCK